MRRCFQKPLREMMAYKFGESAQNFEDAFNWVYYSPIKEWKERIHCVSQCWSQTTAPAITKPITKIDMDRAVKLFYAFKEQRE